MSYIKPHLVNEPHWVYYIYDAEDQLLYIGCTAKYPATRIISLRGETPWIERMAAHHWKAWQYPNGPVAEAMEGRLIDIYHPPINRHRSGVATRKTHPIERHIATASGPVPPRGRWPKRYQLEKEQAS